MGMNNKSGSWLGLAPPLSFRFSVWILSGGILPSATDFRFQKVSGIGSTVSTRTFNEGGQNLYVHRLPERVEYENLVLERGLALGSRLTAGFDLAMMFFEFVPSNVLVMLHEKGGAPAAAWMFRNAYPVNWEVSEFDADENAVVIERMEMAYQNMLVMRI